MNLTEKQKKSTYFRSAQYFHNFAMEAFRFIIPICITGAEATILFPVSVYSAQSSCGTVPCNDCDFHCECLFPRF